MIENQRRFSGDGGDDEFVGGSRYVLTHFDLAVETGQRSFSFFISPHAIGVREGDGFRVAGGQRQRIKSIQKVNCFHIRSRLAGDSVAVGTIRLVISVEIDGFQLWELACGAGADGGEGFCRLIACPGSDSEIYLAKVDVFSVNFVRADLFGRDSGGSGVSGLTYLKLDLCAGVVVNQLTSGFTNNTPAIFRSSRANKFNAILI